MSPISRKLGRPADDTLPARRREEILDAAAVLFAERGYSNTDTQALIKVLHVGKGTLYRYFSSKEELFLAAVDRAMHRLRERVDAAVEGVADPLTMIARAIAAYLRYFEENPGNVELLVQERAQFKDRKQPTYFEHREKNVGRWRELFTRLIAEGRLREVPVERITEVLGNLVYGTMFTNYFVGRRVTLEVQVADILDLVFHGILSEQERAALAGNHTFPEKAALS